MDETKNGYHVLELLVTDNCIVEKIFQKFKNAYLKRNKQQCYNILRKLKLKSP
jgi:hypothetical protein